MIKLVKFLCAKVLFCQRTNGIVFVTCNQISVLCFSKWGCKFCGKNTKCYEFCLKFMVGKKSPPLVKPSPLPLEGGLIRQRIVVFTAKKIFFNKNKNDSIYSRFLLSQTQVCLDIYICTSIGSCCNLSLLLFFCLLSSYLTRF